MGEILAIFRPLLYVTLLRRFGPRSWMPWTLALACEAVALSLTTMAQRILSKVLPTTDAPRMRCAVFPDRSTMDSACSFAMAAHAALQRHALC